MGNTTAEKLTGRLMVTVPYTSRIPKDELEILCDSAKIFKCHMADISRTAIKEYIENHNLRELVAEAKARRARRVK